MNRELLVHRVTLSHTGEAFSLESKLVSVSGSEDKSSLGWAQSPWGSTHGLVEMGIDS